MERSPVLSPETDDDTPKKFSDLTIDELRGLRDQLFQWAGKSARANEYIRSINRRIKELSEVE